MKLRFILSYHKGADMRIIPKDIAHKTFNKKMLGYSVEEVLEFLQTVAHEVEALVRENNNLKENLRDKEMQALKHKEQGETLKNTIETAQKMSQKIREESDREGKLIINDAQQKADFIIRDARESLKRIYYEIGELKRTKVQIEANLRALLQAHLQLLNEQISVLPEASPIMQQQEMIPQNFISQEGGKSHKSQWDEKSHKLAVSPISS